MSLRKTSIRQALVILGFALLLLPACGGSGSSDGIVNPLNAAEKELVGDYQLVDFAVREPSCQECTPDDFDTWGGRLELRADRTATVTVEFCEYGSDPTASCDRDFVWAGDAGLITLYSTDAGEHDVRMQWVQEGMGSMTTDSILPTNDPDSGLLLLAEGRESFRWTRTD